MDFQTLGVLLYRTREKKTLKIYWMCARGFVRSRLCRALNREAGN